MKSVDLLAWTAAPDGGHGVRFALDEGGWTDLSYTSLARQAATAAAVMCDATGALGEPVAIVLPTGPEFIAAYFGALLAGLVPTPIPPPQLLANESVYTEKLAGLMRAAEPRLVVTDAALEPLVCRGLALARRDPPVLLLDAVDVPIEFAPRRLPELGLLQFTSGSSGAPRGTMVGRDNLEANIAMISKWVDFRDGDVVASWLPLFHDMGLIGGLMTPVVNQADLWILRPEQFIRSPRRWLDCFGLEGATLTTAPTFGYAYTRKRLEGRQLPDYDFSRWRIAMIGAERVDAGTLAGFARWLAPHGLDPSVFAPAYGLAEATLAVSALSPGKPARAVRVEPGSLRGGEPVRIAAEATLAEADAVGDGVGWMTSCGPALPGLRVRVLDHRGDEVPEGVVGEIAVAGPSVARGYRTSAEHGSTRFRDGELLTGDAGFALDGELFVIGRIGESFKHRGAMIYVEDLESGLAGIGGLTRGRYVVACGVTDRGPAVAMLAEAERGPWADEVAELLFNQLGDAVPIAVYRGPRGSIERTSSGKPRRRAVWEKVDRAAPGFELLSSRSAGNADA